MITADLADVAELVADLTSTGERIRPPAAAATRATAISTARDGKAFAPRLTGALADSITVTFEGDGAAEIGPTVDYGDYVEYGTSDTPPEPFMGPAFEKNVEPFMTALEQLADQVL